MLSTFCDLDTLAVFVSLEGILELNEVDKSLWSKLVPGQLSGHALKIYTCKNERSPTPLAAAAA